MRRIWLVLKNEFRSTVGKRSFWFTTILFPLVLVGLMVGSQLMGWNAATGTDHFIPVPGETPPLGYVDHSGIIETLPPGIDEHTLMAFSTENEARAAVLQGAIERFAIIPVDYVSGGVVTMVADKFRPVDSFDFPPMLAYTLNSNLLGDSSRAGLLMAPLTQVTKESTSGSGDGEIDNEWALIIPHIVLMAFYFVVIMSSSYMLQSVAREKETRTVEMLLLSVKPRELMAGKILGLAGIALIQMAIWLGGGLAALRWAAPRLAEVGFTRSLPAGFVLWSLAYFVVGYLLFAALLGALGALAPGTREGNQFVFVAIAPLMVPLLMSSSIVGNPNGGLAVFLSLFPLTSIVTMPTRLAASGVAFWELAVGLVILVVVAYLFVLFAARLVRADTLLTTRVLNLKRVVAELRVGGRS